MPEGLNRREFLRALGLTGAAGIALAANHPQEVLAETTGAPMPYRYWWVKNVDKPTVDVDWKVMKRFNEWETTRGSLKKYRDMLYGEGFDKKMLDMQKENAEKWEKDKKPGFLTIDKAFGAAVGYGRPDFFFRGPQKAPRPQDRGMPRYEGTPEENARIIRTALRHMGAGTVGFVELDTNTTMKLIYDQQPSPDKRRQVFENVEEGYETEDKIVIPDKARYAIVYTVQMSGETMKRCPTLTGTNTTGLTYTRMWTIYSQLHEFIRGLGWNSYGTTAFNGLGIYPAMAVMAGLGELSRLNRVISPEYGPMMRETFLLTDLPLAPTKPINFGVMEFCKTCKRCATLCPSKSLSFSTEPTWEVQGPWNNPGHKAYFENSVTCRNYWNKTTSNCGICFAVCPYSQSDDASIQQIWKATAAKTNAFNGAVTRAQEIGFPLEIGDDPMKTPESWWNNENLAEMGIDTTKGGRSV